MFDKNGDHALDPDEVADFNRFLDLDSSPNKQGLQSDTNFLFLDGITFEQWLDGWTRAVERGGHAQFVRMFVLRFKQRKVTTSQLSHSWHFSSKMTNRMMNWSTNKFKESDQDIQARVMGTDQNEMGTLQTQTTSIRQQIKTRKLKQLHVVDLLGASKGCASIRSSKYHRKIKRAQRLHSRSLATLLETEKTDETEKWKKSKSAERDRFGSSSFNTLNESREGYERMNDQNMTYSEVARVDTNLRESRRCKFDRFGRRIRADSVSRDWNEERSKQNMSFPKIKRKHQIERASPDIISWLQPEAVSEQSQKRMLISELVLGMDVVNGLIEIFNVIDHNEDHELSIDEVIKFNIFLDSSSSLERVGADTQLLFDVADTDNDGRITKEEWMNAWTRTAHKLGNTEFIQAFINQYRERKVTNRQLIRVCVFTTRILIRLLKWSRRHCHCH